MTFNSLGYLESVRHSEVSCDTLHLVKVLGKSFIMSINLSIGQLSKLNIISIDPMVIVILYIAHIGLAFPCVPNITDVLLCNVNYCNCMMTHSHQK